MSKHGSLMLALGVVFLWSAAKVISKMSLATLPPYLVAGVIQVVALITIAIYFAWKHKHVNTKFTPAELQMMIVAGVAAYAGANIFLMVGLQYVTGATSGVITAFNPVLAIVLAYAVLKERVGSSQAIGIVCVLAGLFVFMLGSAVSGTWLGVGLLILAELAFVLNDLVTRRIAKNYKKDTAPMGALVGNLVGALVLVPLALVQDGTHFLPKLMQWQILVPLVVVGVIFALGGLFWGQALNRLPIAQASILINTMPFQVAVLSVLFLGESLAVHQVSGGLLVMLGAVMVETKWSPRELFQLKLV